MPGRVRVTLANFNPICFLPSVRLLLVFLVLWIPLREIATGAPKGHQTNAEVYRGGSLEIELKARDRRGGRLQYEVINAPRHGRIENIRPAAGISKASVYVTYVHADDEYSTSDEFVFTARAIDFGGVSSPVKIKLKIKDAEPQLQITPAALDFSAVAGESDTQEILLVNGGGRSVAGRIDPKPPFHVDGEGSFNLRRGQATNIQIRFTPPSSESSEEQRLSPAAEGQTAMLTLRGEARPPFGASLQEKLLVEADGARSGMIAITNLSSSLLQLQIEDELGTAADLPQSTEVETGASAEIPLVIAAKTKNEEVALRIWIRSPHHKQELAITAPAVPPKLQLLTKELDFRKNDPVFLEVRNTGGLGGRFSFELPDGLRCPDGATDFPVAPDETKRVRLLFSRHEEARPTEMTVDLGASGKQKIGIACPPPTASPPPHSPSPAPTVTPSPAQQPWVLNNDVKLERGKNGSTALAWKAAKDGWKDAQLETAEAGRFRIYKAERPQQSWWGAIWDWLSGHTSEATRAAEAIGASLTNRLTIPGDEPEEKMSDGNSGEDRAWKRAALTPDNLNNPSIRWRITARGNNGKTESVSQEFRIDMNQNNLVEAVLPSPKPTPRPIKKPSPTSPPELLEAIKVIAWSNARDGATFIFQMPFDGNVESYRFERMQRYFTLDADVKGASITYEAETFPPGAAEILQRQRARREGKKFDEVAVKFSGLSPGTQVYWRAVPVGKDGKDKTPSDTLHFWTLPPWRISWTGIALAACTFALGTVIFLRWRSRRTSR